MSADQLTERELRLARALEKVLAIATPLRTLPWERDHPVNMARLLDNVAKTAHAALIESGAWD
jgi:hypothetical protein